MPGSLSRILAAIDRGGRAASRGRVSAGSEIALFAVLVLGFGAISARMFGAALYGLTPTLAAVSVIVLARRVGPPGWMSLGLDRAGFRAWPAAVLLPLLALGTAILAAWQLDVTDLRVPDVGGPGRYLLLAIGAVTITSVWSLGEEIGWRGFLLPRLARYGRIRAGLAMGAIWEGWHIITIGFELNHAVAVLAIAFCVNEIAVATRSVWPAAVFHGANNAISGLTGGLTLNASSALPQIAGTAGIVTILVYGVAAIAIITLRPAWSHASTGLREPMTIRSLPAPRKGH